MYEKTGTAPRPGITCIPVHLTETQYTAQSPVLGKIPLLRPIVWTGGQIT